MLYRAIVKITLISFAIVGICFSEEVPRHHENDAPKWCRDVAGEQSRPRGESAREAAVNVLAVIYFVPSNVTYNQAVYDHLLAVTYEMQAWYQWATGGKTWTFRYPEIVRTVSGNQTREHYLNTGDWWGPVFTELGPRGYPVWESGTVTVIWAHGAGWWAGGAQCFDGNCGMAILGVEAFPQFNNVAYSGGICPGGSGVAAWPCTPVGAYVHELGHTLGLPHPFDIPATSSVASHSVMQTHWNFPNYAPLNESPWNLLRAERDTMLNNPFMQVGVTVNQTFSSMDVVNLPAIGAPPTAAFTHSVEGSSATFTNLSSGGTLYYWVFGDGTVSNATNPVHIYSAPGTYTVSLRTTNADAMAGEITQTVTVCCVNTRGNVDCVAGDGVDIADLTVLVDHLFISIAPLCCVEEADVVPDASVDIADLTVLVDHLFISFVALPSCN